MKKIGFCFIISLTVLFTASSQAPQSFKYQAIARDLNGDVIPDQDIGLRITILSGSVDGTTVYSETHDLTTNQFGLFTLNIGEGKNNIGNFSDIGWGTNTHFVKIEIDKSGGQNYSLLGVSQLLSVPYALYAETSGFSDSSKQANTWTETLNEVFVTDPNKKVGIGNTIPDEKLHVSGNIELDNGFAIIQNDTNLIRRYQDSYYIGSQNNSGLPLKNTFVGFNSGEGAAYAQENVLFGYQAGRYIGSGDYNTILGVQAGYNSFNGRYNTYVGYHSGFNASGSYNVFLGYNAGREEGYSNRLYIENSNSSSPLIYGEFDNDLVRINGTLDINNQYQLPTADGNNGQILKTNGSGTLSWHDDTGADTINNLGDARTGGESVFLGSGAGVNDDLTNNQNVALGIKALTTNVSGDNNTAIGYNALYSNTIGVENTSNGAGALYYNSSGNQNTAVGYHSLYSNTDGYYNTAIGERALFYNKSGKNNTAIGSVAASYNTNGNYNTAIGREAIFFNKNGSRNTVIGYQAGMGVVNNNVSGNIFIGYQAGINETSDNKLYIENSNSSTPLVYGEFDSDKLAVNGSLGIGIMNPGKVLHVDANNDSLLIDNLAGTGTLLSIDSNGKVFRSTTSLLGLDTSFDYWIDSLYLRNSDTIMTIKDNGNVGIATVDPSQMLELGFGGNIKMNYVEPPGAVTATLNPAAGNINGTNSYIATFVTERGETEMGAYGGYVSGAVNQQVDISNIPIGPKDVIARNIYRSSAGSGYSFKLVTTINDNTTTTYTDNVPDASLGKVASASNTTGGRIYLNNSILIESGAYKVVIGRDAGNLDNPSGSDGTQGIFIGPYAGKVNSGSANVFIGYAAAENTTTGSMNTFIGQRAGNANTTGVSNTYLGIQTGSKNVNGNDNLAVGAFAAVESTSGNSNVYLGAAAGRFKTGGSNNTMVGKYAGYQGGSGSGNVFLGHRAGYGETGNNFLYIDNSSTSSPLIWGDFANNRVNINGRLGVGTTNPSEELEVIGNIRMVDGSQANGKIMMSDANGTGSWADPTSVGQWHVTPHSINPNNISPVNSNIHMFSITGNTANELTLGQLTDLNDVSNYSGAVFEVKGSGPDYTNNMFFGKYSDNYYVPSWAGNGVISTDQDLALASVGSTDPTNPNPDPRIFFQIGGGYTSPIDIMDLNSSGLAFTSGGVRINEFLDEDDLASDSDTKLATQQSIKAYVDNAMSGTVKEINDLDDGKTGGNSVFLGNGSGLGDDASDNRNVAIGDSTLKTNSSGYWNTATGYQALYSNTTARENTANGYKALTSNLTGFENTALGALTLYNNKTGRSNTAVGYRSLWNNESGRCNVAVGDYALYMNSNAEYNASVGHMSLRYNETGDRNTALGAFSLYFNTSGLGNIGIGNAANYHNMEGNYNTVIGYEAGQGTFTHNKSGNVFIGYRAGFYEHGDNKLYIENSNSNSPLIWGDFNLNLLNINGNLGLGTNSPDYRLQVNGDAVPETDLSFDLGKPALRWNNIYAGNVHATNVTGGEWTDHQNGFIYAKQAALNGDTVVITDNGELGIGVSNPGGALHVTTGNFGLQMSNSLTGLPIPGTAFYYKDGLETYYNGIVDATAAGGPLCAIMAYLDSARNISSAIRLDHDHAFISMDDETFHRGVRIDTTALYLSYNNNIIGQQGIVKIDTNSHVLLQQIYRGDSTISTDDYSVQLVTDYNHGIFAKGKDQLATNSALNVVDSAWHTLFRVMNNGNVGVGMYSPNYKLQVDGDAVPKADLNYDLGKPFLRWDNLYVGTVNASSIIGGEWTDHASNYIFASQSAQNGDTVAITDNGFVGIGIANPQGKFHAKNGNYGIWLSDALAGSYPGSIHYYIEKYYAYYSGVVEREPGVEDIAAIMGFHDFSRGLDNNIEIDSNEIRINYNKTTSEGRINIDSTRMELRLNSLKSTNHGIVRIDSSSNILLQQYHQGDPSNPADDYGVSMRTDFNDGIDISGWGPVFSQSVLSAKSNNGITLLKLLNNGNFGINNPTPNQTLDVNGTVNATSFMVNGAAGFNGTIPVYNTGVSGQTNGITVVNGIITGYTTIP